MKILIVCGAGASSTFVAQRVRRAAGSREIDVSAVACPLSGIDAQFAGADVILLGPHLTTQEADIRSSARSAGVAVAVMPPSVFSSPVGDEALDLALSAAGARMTPEDHHRQATEDTFHG